MMPNEVKELIEERKRLKAELKQMSIDDPRRKILELRLLTLKILVNAVYGG